MSLARERSEPLRWPWFSKYRAWWMVGIVLAVLTAVGAGVYVSTRPETSVASHRDVVASLHVTGEVIAPPGEWADVPAPYRAPVARVLTTVGANVKRGDVLVELARPSVQAAYEQARQALQAAETSYANAKRLYGSEIKTAEERLAAARAAEQSARAAIQVKAAPLPEETDVTAQEAAPDLEMAMQARFDAELALTQARARMEAALLPYRRQLEAAQVAFREAQAGQKQAMIRSPIRGTVLALNAQPGAEIGKDTDIPVATIVDLDALQIVARMKPDEALQVKPEMPVSLTIEGLPTEQFRGRVRSITTLPPKPLRRSRYVAVVEIENERGLLKPGMKAQAAIKTDEAQDVLAVPSNAIRHDRSGRAVVSVLRAEQWQRVLVETGLTDWQYTEVTNGLRPGETVQVRPELI